MQRWMGLLLAILVVSSSAFFLYTGKAEVAEAKVCEPGQIVDYNRASKCSALFDSREDIDKKTDGLKLYMMTFTNTLIAVSTALAALAIVYSGYKYITSQGEPMKLQEAKNWLFRTAIGVFVLFSAYALFNLFKIFFFGIHF